MYFICENPCEGKNILLWRRTVCGITSETKSYFGDEQHLFTLATYMQWCIHVHPLDST